MPKANVRTLLGIALIAAVALVVYWPSLHGGFIWDDELLLTQNPLVKASDGLSRMWFSREPIDYWPMTNSVYWLEWRLFGMQPAGYHATTLVLHFANALMTWAVMTRLSIRGGFVAALFFAAHPLNVESVAWIAQLKNTLSLFFFLIAIWCYLRSLVPPRGSRFYILSVVSFVLAMLSKGSVATLPLLLLLLTWWRQSVLTPRDIVRTIPFWIVSVALTVVNVSFQTHAANEAIRSLSMMQRLLEAGAVVWFYLWKAIVPLNLMFVYPQWTIDVSDVRWWLPLLSVLAVTGLLVWLRQSRVVRGLLFAWMFFLIALIPVMGFTDVYFMKYSPVADHYAYVALLSVCALAAAALTRGTKKPAGPLKDPAGRVAGTRRA